MPADPAAPPPLLRVEALTKSFPGVIANDRLNLEVRAGEVHAVLGENGAGKSTLMNILGGRLAPDAGEIQWEGRKVSLASPRAAAALGIAMVHQHYLLVPRLSVLENVTLGLPRFARGRPADAERRLRALLGQFETKIDPRQAVETLSVGERQKVEIIKALFRQVRLLILDEPTAALAPHEARQLFRIGRAVAAQGNAVIFITHRMDEVHAFGDRVTVLRAGRNVGTFATAETEPRALVRLMVGRELAPRSVRAPRAPGAVLLEAVELATAAGEGAVGLDRLSLEVRAGEIVGIAGVDGNGQDELVEALLGLRRLRAGRITLNSQDLSSLDTAAILAGGLGVVPGDRHAAAIIEDFDLRQNVLLGLGPTPPWVRGGWLDWRRIGQTTTEIVQRFQVRAPRPEDPIARLSGGHQQRLVLGRVLHREPRVLVAAQPTRGLDVGSAALVRERLLGMRAAGRGVLLLSMDLDEVLELSDRIAVIFAGRIIGWATPTTSRTEIGLLMTGIAPRRGETP